MLGFFLAVDTLTFVIQIFGVDINLYEDVKSLFPHQLSLNKVYYREYSQFKYVEPSKTNKIY